MSTIAMSEAGSPRGMLTFKAIKQLDEDRIRYIGSVPVFDLIDKGFVEPVASVGLAPEILAVALRNGPVQRKTNPRHVQAIVDYIVERAEAGLPFTFNAIVLDLDGAARVRRHLVRVRYSGRGACQRGAEHRRGPAPHLRLGCRHRAGQNPRRQAPGCSDRACRRIEQASIPVIVIEEPDLGRQKRDFHTLNLQKPLSTTVLNLTDDTALSEITRRVILDVRLFEGRIDLNNASAGARSDKLLAFAQLRFIVASDPLGTGPGRNTRSSRMSRRWRSCRTRGRSCARCSSLIATSLGGLERLQRDRVSRSGAFVRQLRAETLLASSALWRALTVALHEASRRRRRANGDRAAQDGRHLLGAHIRLLRRHNRRPRHGQAALHPRKHRRRSRQAVLRDDETRVVTQASWSTYMHGAGYVVGSGWG